MNPDNRNLFHSAAPRRVLGYDYESKAEMNSVTAETQKRSDVNDAERGEETG